MLIPVNTPRNPINTIPVTPNLPKKKSIARNLPEELLSKKHSMTTQLKK